MNADTDTEKLTDMAAKVAKHVTETNARRMGFTMEEVDKINQSLWDYECALNQYASKTSSEDAQRFHYSLDEDVQAHVHRAFIMFGRKLEACTVVA